MKDRNRGVSALEAAIDNPQEAQRLNDELDELDELDRPLSARKAKVFIEEPLIVLSLVNVDEKTVGQMELRPSRWHSPIGERVYGYEVSRAWGDAIVPVGMKFEGLPTLTKFGLDTSSNLSWRDLGETYHEPGREFHVLLTDAKLDGKTLWGQRILVTFKTEIEAQAALAAVERMSEELGVGSNARIVKT